MNLSLSVFLRNPPDLLSHPWKEKTQECQQIWKSFSSHIQEMRAWFSHLKFRRHIPLSTSHTKGWKVVPVFQGNCSSIPGKPLCHEAQAVLQATLLWEALRVKFRYKLLTKWGWFSKKQQNSQKICASCSSKFNSFCSCSQLCILSSSRKFETESYPVQVKNDAIGNTDDCMESTLSNLGKSITSFQSFIGGIEREASKLNKVESVEL